MAVVGRRHPWLPDVAARFVAAFEGRTRPRLSAAARLIGASLFEHEIPTGSVSIPRTRPPVAAAMYPVPAARAWGLPELVTVRELADWLCLGVEELEWLANLRGTASPGHYHYQTVEKRDGSLRVLEAPKVRLKAAQRRILREILDLIPGHESVHGFRQGRSIRSFAAPHVGQRFVLRMDLRDFFPSVGRARVQAVFRTLGYPEAVADLLGGLCTNAAPLGGPRYRSAHLPQGAPTSPALANLCFYRADCRLAGLARKAGLVYTRYADDLAFSGERVAEALIPHVGSIAEEEGFAVQYRKTRRMGQGVRQHLAGLVVNAKCNVDRAGVDALKATLHNCLRTGPAAQNQQGHPAFREHLTGRVAFVESVNPERGRKLRAVLDKIRWQDPA